MEEYLNKDKIVEHLTERHNALCKEYGETDQYCEGYGDAMLFVESSGCADVVPRSEVEKYIVNMNAYGLTAKRLAEENEQLKQDKQVLEAELSRYTENCKQMSEKAKQEVEDLKCQLEREREYIEFLKVNIVSGKQDVAREIFEELAEVFLTLTLKDGEKATLVDFKRYAELKKKYIGKDTDVPTNTEEVTENE